MKRRLTYTTKAAKNLKKMPQKQALKITDALEKIAQDNAIGLDIKKLQGMEGFRLRVGQYRAVYTINMVIMNVENIGSRGNIY